MSVEIDDTDPRRDATGAIAVLRQAGPAGECHLVATAQHQRALPRIQQCRDTRGQLCLGRFQCIVVTSDSPAS